MKREKRKHPAQTPSKKAVKPNREVLKRFFDNESPIQEVQTVHEWFATAQGQKICVKRIR
ncbi:hypothetical protein Q0590_35425 [Rhodocytophaga aerolata]|uniref:Uncharacterized protein n=1 Tax=Rhodocytophaga aerolata TaxID=455078 RepID=A0ABT8RJZ0_9BACT|nr:hypothetical protein [Rhodocytophaga aerolata]MDO1451618.1 hypothetical protein [Rhodocytophaga aerolata]